MIELYKYWGLYEDENAIQMISIRYLDRLIECMTNLYNINSTLTDEEKTYEIEKYLMNDNVDECLKYARPTKLYHKLMYLPLKNKSVFLCSLMAKFINHVKYGNTKLFNKLKKNR